MRKRDTIKTIGSIATLVFTIVNGVFMVRGVVTEVLGFNVPWGWLALGGFIAFCGFVYSLLKAKNAEINELRESKPSVIVTPMEEQGLYKLYKLQVENVGGKDVFKAQIKIIDVKDDSLLIAGREYIGFWEHAFGGQSEILNGQHDRVELAALISYPPNYQSEHLDLYFYNPQNRDRGCFFSSSSYHIGSYYTDAKGQYVGPASKPEFIIGVTISSDRTSKEGLFYKEYKLTLDGIEECQ